VEIPVLIAESHGRMRLMARTMGATSTFGTRPFLLGRMACPPQVPPNLARQSPQCSASAVFQLLLQFVPLLPGDFQIEHQVFDVQAQLRQGFLDE
jgi:hypothetical protein